jgi:hypothetical protein
MEGGRASEEVFWILWKVLWEERSEQITIKRSEMRRGEGDRFWRAELERQSSGVLLGGGENECSAESVIVENRGASRGVEIHFCVGLGWLLKSSAAPSIGPKDCKCC